MNLISVSLTLAISASKATGSGNNFLKLNLRDLLTTYIGANTLKILGNSGDQININSFSNPGINRTIATKGDGLFIVMPC
jgi:hypothetical protein